MKKTEMVKIGAEKLKNLPRKLERGIILSANDRYMISYFLLSVFTESGLYPPIDSNIEINILHNKKLLSDLMEDYCDWEWEEEEFRTPTKKG